MNQYNEVIKGKLFKYFQEKLRLKQSTKGWWRSDCPNCGGFHTMGIHLEYKRVKCFKCDYQSSPIDFLMLLENFQTYQEARNFLNIQSEFEAYSRIEFKPKVSEIISIELPNSFTSIINGNSIMGKSARYYMKKRGFNINKLALSGVGYCTEGEYSGYIIFPYYSKGKLVYFQGRRYMGYGPKMKNPEGELYGVGKSSLIYNEDALFIYNKIYTVESITNCLTLGDNSIALSGKSISMHQYSRIISSPCQNLIIILDPDAMEEAFRLGMKMIHYKKIKVVKLPENKDVNDIGKKETLKIVNKSPYLNYNDLLKLKNSLNAGSISSYKRIRPNYSTTRGVS